MRPLRITGAFAAAAFITACAGPANTNSGSFTPQTHGLPQPAGSARISSLLRHHATSCSFSDIYVANSNNSTVTIYTPHFSAGANAQFIRTITQGLSAPTQLALDSAGNLYVGNWKSNNVTEYSECSSTPNALVGTITNGIDGPTSLMVDGNDNLWVANQKSNSVTEYLAGAKTPALTLTNGVNGPSALAWGGGNNNSICVANTGNNSVACYNMSSGSRSRVITAGINFPTALAWDPSNNLYVADEGSNSITVYPPSGTSVSMKITTDLLSPSSLAFDTIPGFGYLWVANANGNTITAYDSTGTERGYYNEPYFVGVTDVAQNGPGNDWIATVGANYVTGLELDSLTFGTRPHPSSVFAPTETALSGPAAVTVGP